DVVGAGIMGPLVHVEAAFEIPDGGIPRGDIRWDLALGGGATMDLGCYPIQWVRHAVSAAGEAALPEVVRAGAVVPAPEIDGSLVAQLRWPSGVTGEIRSSMIGSADDTIAYLLVRGERGTLIATNPLGPQHRRAELRIETAGGTTVEPIAASATYWHQLIAFRDAIVHGLP